MTASEPKSAAFFPREHGATAMLILPFLCAGALARAATPLEAVALAGVLLAFALKEPLIVVARQSFVWKQKHPETGIAWRYLALELPALLACAAYLLWRGPRGPFALLAAGACTFGALAVWVNLRNRQRSAWFQVASAVALTSSSLAASLAALGALPVWAWVLWVLSAVQAAAGILVIHARLDARASTHRTEPSQRGSRRTAKVSIAVLVGAAVAAGVLGYRWIIPAALVVAAAGYGWELRRHTDPRAVKKPLKGLGLQALALSAIYAAMLVAGLWR